MLIKIIVIGTTKIFIIYAKEILNKEISICDSVIIIL